MSATFTIDATGFSAALEQYLTTTQRDLADILNQRAYNVAGRAAGLVPLPGGAQAQRARVREYLRQDLSTRVRLATSGKRKGKIIRSGARSNQLQRVHLIVQAIRRKQGRKGLYGGGSERTGKGYAGDKRAKVDRTGFMKAYSGEVVRRATLSVGYLRAIWIPIVRGLFPHIKYRRIEGPEAHPFRGIALFEGSVTRSSVKPAKPGFNPFAELVARIPTHQTPRLNSPGADARILAVERAALQGALDAEARELTEHVAKKLQQEANRINAR